MKTRHHGPLFAGLSVKDALYVSGVNNSGGFVIKLTAAGDTAWTRQLESSHTESVIPAAVAADSAGVTVAIR